MSVFDAFYKALKGKQVLVYSGLFKDARKKLKNGELDYLKEVDPTEYIYQIFILGIKRVFSEWNFWFNRKWRTRNQSSNDWWNWRRKINFLKR